MTFILLLTHYLWYLTTSAVRGVEGNLGTRNKTPCTLEMMQKTLPTYQTGQAGDQMCLYTKEICRSCCLAPLVHRFTDI